MARYSTILQAVIDRITAHTKPTKRLAGWRFAEGAPITSEVEGQKDYPIARMLIPDMPEKEHDQLPLIQGTMIIKLVVSTERAKGIVAHVKAVETFADALDLDDTDLDLLLGGIMSKPFAINIHDPFTPENGISINTSVTMTVTPLESARGGRS